MKFLAMHITNQKWSFDIFTVGNLQNIFMEHDLSLLNTPTNYSNIPKRVCFVWNSLFINKTKKKHLEYYLMNL